MDIVIKALLVYTTKVTCMYIYVQMTAYVYFLNDYASVLSVTMLYTSLLYGLTPPLLSY